MTDYHISLSDSTSCSRTVISEVKDYIALLKPRVMTLVVFTGIAGMWVAPGFSDMHPFLILISIFALSLGAGAAGAVNMWYDRDIDSVMSRTQKRPIPAGKIASDDALLFAIVCSVAAVLLLGLASNWMAAGLLAFANLFYSVFYTMMLKRRTPQNIVIGGAAGAFPPLIGWVAITGDLAFYPIILFAVIFFWTPPHFWALSLYSNQDYKKANVPMLPVVVGEDATRRAIVFYSLVLSAITILPYLCGFVGHVYAFGNIVLNILFLVGAFRVYHNHQKSNAVQLFAYSIFYLFAWFTLVMIDSTTGGF